MLELADIVRRHGPQYLARYQQKLLPSHRRALADIAACRTAKLGGHVYLCPPCQQRQYQYHSCKNRHCPKCQNDQATRWLTRQRRWLLPTHYFLLTFTLPAALRPLARSHQKLGYRLLFQTAAAALQKLALDPRFVGGQMGMIAVLHTWTRTLGYHPHVHFLIPGGGLTPKGHWRFSEKDFFLPAPARAPNLPRQVPRGLEKKLPVLLRPSGRLEASLGRVLRTGRAGRNRLEVFCSLPLPRRALQPPPGQARSWPGDLPVPKPENSTEPPADLTRAPVPLRFLQHVLPEGFVKVRY